MSRGYVCSALLSTVLLIALAGAATAQVPTEAVPSYAGHAYVDLASGKTSWNAPLSPTVLGGDVYSNTASPPNFGISSTDLGSVWGDRVTTTGAGFLDENDFTIYNSSSSAGNLLTVSFNIAFFNGATNLGYGGYTTGVASFGAGLPPGFYSILTLTGLGGTGILLSGTDVLMTQQVATHTGPADRLGIASLDPPTIGSSTNQMYINSSTVGPAGYYTLGSPPLNANPGYRINVAEATPAQPTTWGRLKSLYR